MKASKEDLETFEIELEQLELLCLSLEKRCQGQMDLEDCITSMLMVKMITEFPPNVGAIYTLTTSLRHFVPLMQKLIREELLKG